MVNDMTRSVSLLLGLLTVFCSVTIISFTGSAFVLLSGQHTNGLTESELLQIYGNPILRVPTTNVVAATTILRTPAMRESDELWMYPIGGYTLVVGVKHNNSPAYGAYSIIGLSDGFSPFQMILTVTAICVGCTVLIFGTLAKRRKGSAV